MAQSASRPCPTCGNQVAAGQRFCNNCGTDLSRVETPSQYGGQQPYSQSPYGQPQQPFQYQQPQQPQQYQQPQKTNPIAEALGALGLLFFMRRYRPGYTPRRQSSGCCGCLVALVILGLIFGIPGYIAYRSAGPNLFQRIQNTVTSSTNNNGGILSTRPPASPTTTQLNKTITYAGIDITMVNVQQASSFSDDQNNSANQLLRLNMKETASSTPGRFLYTDVMRLVLPDKSTVGPTQEQNDIATDPGTSRANWIDFPIPTNLKADQLTLLLGRNTEAQMSIPLSSNANLSAYQSKTVNPNVTTHYNGLTWTMTSATLAWSYDGKQADKGMRYVFVQFRIDNPTSQQFVSGFPDEYMRLKAGDSTNAPTGNTTLPTTIAPASSGATGIVGFQVPEGVSSYTLILLARTNVTPAVAQATMDFQIK